MSHRTLIAASLVCVFGAGLWPAACPAAPAPDTAAFARQVWTITDLVLDKHVAPCTRQEMLLGGVRRLLEAAGRQPPADLSRRVSALTTQEQFTALLQEVWPTEGAKTAKPEELEGSFLEGLLAAVPGKPPLITPAALKLEEQVAGNRYVGIGIQIRLNEEEHFPQIVDPFRGGPARRGGVRAGDLIVEVDGKDTRDVRLRQVVDWLRGEEGTSLTLVVRQPKETETRRLTLTRTKVPFDTVVGFRRQSEEAWGYRVDPDVPVAYARVLTFNSATLHHLRQLERTLRADGARALVLDLRFSTAQGVDLKPAEQVADALLDGGVMWRVHEAGGVREVRADSECLFRGWPLAVLVSGDMMGLAPEAVAAALQDNGRAVVVGEPVAPRVTERSILGEPVGAPDAGRYVTSLFHLPDERGGVMLRTARLERAGRDRDWPVRPDHVVTMDRKLMESLAVWLREQELSDPPAGARDRPPDDPQLAKAIELLRAALRKGTDAGKSESNGR
jgi:carboxyl-terminal processing protease